MASAFPSVAAWTNSLREAFGVAEMNQALRDLGYYASEGGRTVDTRKNRLGDGIPASDMVIGPLPAAPTKARRG